jgi:lipoprotein-releasing system permease protein
VYQVLLTRRYLTSKVMPLLAALAVMLCTAMELIVWSVMGGFLVMLMESGRTLIGDVEISHDNTGLAYYQDLIDRLQKDPMVEAAAPTIETFGLLSLPYANGAKTILVKGVEPGSFNRVTGYDASVWWRPLEKPLPKDVRAEDPRVPYHDYAFRVAEAAQAFLKHSASEVAGSLKAPVQRVDALRDAAKRSRRLADIDRPVSPEYITELKEAGGAVQRAGEDLIAAATAGKGQELYEQVVELTAAAARFDRADGNYRGLETMVMEGAQLSRNGEPAMVLGTQVGGYNVRQPEGFLTPVDPMVFLPNLNGTLSVVPMDRQGRVLTMDQKPRKLPIANQFRSGIFEIDAQTVLVRLDALQRMLMLDEQKRVAAPPSGAVVTNPDGTESFEKPAATQIQPARVTNILVRARPGIVADDLRRRATEIYERFAADHAADVSPPPSPGSGLLRIETWRDKNATLIGAVEKETALVMFIFGVISLTSVFLVLAIFWAMVSEKTRDIGVLRAIGGSRTGVAGLWIGYGLAIGVIGSILGGVAAYLIVTNINPIHEWLGAALGITIWDPRVYYFTNIPSSIDPARAAIVLVGGVVASVVGAAIPAIKAANMDPVRALRWE